MPDGTASSRGPGRRSLLAKIGPGVLLAATGVGAGDLATAGIAGTNLGLVVAWAVVLGAVLKYVLTEGLARWQLATGQTLLEGASRRLGTPFRVVFLLYLLPWAFFTGGALISASGTAMDAIVPIRSDDPGVGRVVYGIGHSVIGVVLVLLGGFRLFERVMTAAVGVMVLGVLATAVLSRPDLSELVSGLAVPRVPSAEGGLTWTVALLGGVGGTVTILCYGYWIREEGRSGAGALRETRVDLAIGYAMTCVFGVAMLVIASRTPASGSGSGLLVSLGESLGETLGPVGKWAFLVGAWAAIASSLLGVWQAVPYLFADFLSHGRRGAAAGGACGAVPLSGTRAYRGFLIALAVVPIPMLFVSFKVAQQYYAVFGATFIPALAALLLVMNGRASWVGAGMKNRVWSAAALGAAVLLFGWFAWMKIGDVLAK